MSIYLTSKNIDLGEDDDFNVIIHRKDAERIGVKEGEIVSIIGSNGAGKSTLLRTISGLIPARSGTVRFQGEEIQSTTADAIVKMGISHSPEGRRIFTNMTVHENLLLGAFIRDDNEISSDMEAVLDRFPRMRERFKQNAGTLSGGEQQMLAIGRALMSRPKLLLLDEPSLGLAPNLVAEIVLSDSGKALLTNPKVREAYLGG